MLTPHPHLPPHPPEINKKVNKITEACYRSYSGNFQASYEYNQ